MLLSGKLNAALHIVTDCDPDGLLKPMDKCTKTGRPFIDVIQEKYPELIVPEAVNFDEHPGGKIFSESPHVCCHEETVA